MFYSWASEPVLVKDIEVEIFRDSWENFCCLSRRREASGAVLPASSCLRGGLEAWIHRNQLASRRWAAWGLKNQQLVEVRGGRRKSLGSWWDFWVAKPAATSAYLWSANERHNRCLYCLCLCYMWNAFPDDMPVLWLDLDLTHSVYIRKLMQFLVGIGGADVEGNSKGFVTIMERERETSSLAFNIK